MTALRLAGPGVTMAWSNPTQVQPRPKQGGKRRAAPLPQLPWVGALCNRVGDHHRGDGGTRALFGHEGIHTWPLSTALSTLSVSFLPRRVKWDCAVKSWPSTGILFQDSQQRASPFPSSFYRGGLAQMFGWRLKLDPVSKMNLLFFPLSTARVWDDEILWECYCGNDLLYHSKNCSSWLN